MIYNKAIETLPIKELRKLQNKRLETMLNRIYTKVPFYKNKFDLVKILQIDKIKIR